MVSPHSIRTSMDIDILTIYRDQELRFTVHDSPDYYQLKVSVFNDDKKTELIGETWVNLESIIKPGGGKNDVWHALNCKGRYAGDIRIELTYYDTRPREEKPEGRRQSAPLDSTSAQNGGGVGGPRELKPVKRRPLPTDPTDSARSSPHPPTAQAALPTTPQSNQQRYAESPDAFGFEKNSSYDRGHHNIQYSQHGASPLAADPEMFMQQDADLASTSPQHPSAPEHPLRQQSVDSAFSRQDVPQLYNRMHPDGYPHQQTEDYESGHVDGWGHRPVDRPLAQPLQNSQDMIHPHSLPTMPTMIDARPRQRTYPAQQHYGSSPPKTYAYGDLPNQQFPPGDDFHAWPNVDASPAVDPNTPPPPPVHRNSGSRQPPQSHLRGVSDPYASVPPTAPLNIRNGRGSMTGSPLSQSQSNEQSQPQHVPSPSPSFTHSSSQSVPYGASYTSYNPLRHQRSHSPVRDYEQEMPPSLVPGYEPSIAEDESERILQEKRLAAHHYSDPPQPHFQQGPIPIDPALLQNQRAYAANQTAYHQRPAVATPLRSQPQPRNVENIQARRPHRASAPVYQPPTASPNLRTPVRKSVSPSPGAAPTERRHSEIPFSPDSFDAFNPSISASNSVNEPGARYNTPEQAKEASIEHERRERLGDGPIIGNDGRIIDPSDHLPTETWAPEPEQKTPKKGPQVTMRFRHNPQGAQPISAVRRPAVEHSVSSPAAAPGQPLSTPPSTGRMRLQKRNPITAAQPASSPIVPTLNSTPRSSPLRASESSYPLRERDNYGGYGSSPTYGRPSPGNIPPPIPGKVPIDVGQEDWDNSALSEEMRRIDIGVGGGQGRQRRSRFGY